MSRATSPPPAAPRWRDPRVWLGLLVSASFLALLLRRVDGGELRDAIAGVEPAWLLAAGGVYFAGLWVRALRWRLVLRPHLELAPDDAFALLVIGYSANNVLPVRAGEVIRAGLLQQRHGAPWATGLGTIVVERVLDGLVLALLLGGTVLLAGGSGLLRVLAALGLAGFVAALLLMVALGWSGGRDGHRARRLLPLLPARLRARAEVWLASFLAGITALQGARVWSALLILTVATWLLEAGSYWLVGLSFGLPLAAPLYLGLCGAANLAIAAPSTAGGIGPFEFFAREVAVAFGASLAAATAYALVLHALVLVPVVLLGVVFLWRRHLGVRALLRAPTPPVEAAE